MSSVKQTSDLILIVLGLRGLQSERSGWRNERKQASDWAIRANDDRVTGWRGRRTDQRRRCEGRQRFNGSRATEKGVGKRWRERIETTRPADQVA